MTQFAASPAPQSTQRITTLTRRNIFDYLRGEGGPWWGRLDEIDFLGPLYDLDRLASTDPGSRRQGKTSFSTGSTTHSTGPTIGSSIFTSFSSSTALTRFFSAS
jgi:hypothetical protein